MAPMEGQRTWSNSDKIDYQHTIMIGFSCKHAPTGHWSFAMQEFYIKMLHHIAHGSFAGREQQIHQCVARYLCFDPQPFGAEKHKLFNMLCNTMFTVDPPDLEIICMYLAQTLKLQQKLGIIYPQVWLQACCAMETFVADMWWSTSASVCG